MPALRSSPTASPELVLVVDWVDPHGVQVGAREAHHSQAHEADLTHERTSSCDEPREFGEVGIREGVDVFNLHLESAGRPLARLRIMPGRLVGRPRFESTRSCRLGTLPSTEGIPNMRVGVAHAGHLLHVRR